MVCLWHFSDIEAAPSNSAPGFLSDLAAKVLNSTEDAHTKTMSTFETDELFGHRTIAAVTARHRNAGNASVSWG